MARAEGEKGCGKRSGSEGDGAGLLGSGEPLRSPYLTKALESSLLDTSASSLLSSENLRTVPSSGGGSVPAGLLGGLDSLERLPTSIFGLDGEDDLLLEGGGDAASSSLIALSLSI